MNFQDVKEIVEQLRVTYPVLQDVADKNFYIDTDYGICIGVNCLGVKNEEINYSARLFNTTMNIYKNNKIAVTWEKKGKDYFWKKVAMYKYDEDGTEIFNAEVFD